MKKLYHGAAFYPELWDAATIKKDIQLMQEAGINVVRIGEFSWSSLEPHQDEFHTNYFVRTIGQLAETGIETIICTPTPTPPVWISHDHPERMLVNDKNVIMVHGGRQQVCTNNSFFRERASIIVEKMAQVYGRMEGVIAWQIDNELKGNVAECYCNTCKSLWRDWLKAKYKDIEVLNKAWGTHVWSQYYEDFSQVPQPKETPMGHNPSLSTAYRLFSREKTADFIKMQADMIRNFSDRPITHNSSLYHYIDNQMSFADLDFAAFDHYSESDNFQQMIFWADTFKTLNKDKPFWVMETAPSNCASINGHLRIHDNGYLKAEAAAIYALGGQGFCYWLWRQHRTGAEQTHGHLLTSWGDKSLGFYNAQKVAALRKKLEPLLQKTSPARASLAVTYSDRARAFFLTEPLENKGFDYRAEMMQLHKTIMYSGIHRDLIFEDHSFAGYKVLFTPYLPYVSDDYKLRAKRFVQDGGTWIIGPLTGTRTGEQTIPTDRALSDLEEFAGVRTVYHFPMTGAGIIGQAFSETAPLMLYSSVFECLDAVPVGITSGGVVPDMPYITECSRGRGKVVMLGSMPYGSSGEKMLQKMLLHYLEQSGSQSIYNTEPGTIVVPRKGQNLEQLIVINMDGQGGSVKIRRAGYDALAGQRKDAGEIKVEPYGCLVVEFSD